MILVVGSTGILGGMITRKLLGKGESVRILVRPHSAYQPLVEAGARPVFGDLKDPPSLAEACKGIELVVTTANSAMRGGEDNVATVDLKGNHDLVDAAKAAGVHQFIFTSALGVSTESPVPFMQAKARTEEHLKASGTPYTILEPNAYMEVWPGMIIGAPAMQRQRVMMVGKGMRKHSFVSAGDVAEFAVAAVRNPQAGNRTIVIGGPEPLSFHDCISIYEHVLGHPIVVHTVEPGEVVPGLNETTLALQASFDTFDSPIDMAETARTFGVRLTPLAEIVGQQVARVPAGAPA